LSREQYSHLRTFGGISLEYLSLVETDFTATAGSAYSPPERGDFRRIAGSRQIQLLQDSPGVIESFQTSQAELFLPANTTSDSTNDAGDGRLYFVKNSGTGSLLIKDYLGTTLWTVNEVGSILVVGNDNNNWDFYFRAENLFYDNTDSGLAAENIKDAIDELSATASVSASPGFTWGDSGNTSKGSYLLNDTVPSNTSGRVVPLNGFIEKVFIAIQNPGTVSIANQKRTGATMTTIATVTITSARVATINVSVPVSLGDELGIRVSPSSSGSPKNPVVGLIIKGSLV
jgi:hypothetical protein